MKILIDSLDIDWLEKDYGATTKKIEGKLYKIIFEVIEEDY